MDQPQWRRQCAVDERSTHLTCAEHNGAEKFLNSSTMAHAGEAHLFLKKHSTYSPHLGFGEIPTEKLKPESHVPRIL